MSRAKLWMRLSLCAGVLILVSGFAKKQDLSVASGGEEKVWMGRPAGARSCEPDSGLQWKQVLGLMREAQVQVHRVADGTDGKRRVQLCGTPTGRWVGVQISASDVAQVEATGWKPWPAGMVRENEREASESLKKD